MNKKTAHEIAKLAALKAYKSEMKKLGQSVGKPTPVVEKQHGYENLDIDIKMPGAPVGNRDKSRGGEVKYSPFAERNTGFDRKVPEGFAENYQNFQSEPTDDIYVSPAQIAAEQTAGQAAYEAAKNVARPSVGLANELPYVIIDGIKYQRAEKGDPLTGLNGEQLDSNYDPVPYKEAKINPKLLRIASVYQNILNKKSNRKIVKSASVEQFKNICGQYEKASDMLNDFLAGFEDGFYKEFLRESGYSSIAEVYSKFKESEKNLEKAKAENDQDSVENYTLSLKAYNDDLNSALYLKQCVEIVKDAILNSGVISELESLDETTSEKNTDEF